MVQWKRKLR